MRIVFTVPDGLDLLDVEQTLQLVLISLEALHGVHRVRVEAGYFADEKGRRFILDGSTPIGRDAATMFAGLAAHAYELPIAMTRKR